MNPETEQNINEAIDWLQQTGASIQDFAVEQAPLYCREVVAWELWGGIASATGCFVCAAVIVYLVWRFREPIAESIEEMEFMVPLATIASVVMFFLFVGQGATSAGKAIKAAVAPRLVIVEHLRGLR